VQLKKTDESIFRTFVREPPFLQATTDSLVILAQHNDVFGLLSPVLFLRLFCDLSILSHANQRE
jgi:hypothetical protein